MTDGEAAKAGAGMAGVMRDGGGSGGGNGGSAASEAGRGRFPLGGGNDGEGGGGNGGGRNAALGLVAALVLSRRDTRGKRGYDGDGARV